MTRLLNTPAIGPWPAMVASSWMDMLAGLSKKYIFSMPPGFWANADPAASADTNPTATAARRAARVIVPSRFDQVFLYLCVFAGGADFRRPPQYHLSSQT